MSFLLNRSFGESHVIPCLVAHCKFDDIENLLQIVWPNEYSTNVLRKSFCRVSFLTLPSYFKNNNGENLSDTDTVALSGLEKYREVLGVEVRFVYERSLKVSREIFKRENLVFI